MIQNIVTLIMQKESAQVPRSIQPDALRDQIHKDVEKKK
jgi:hypothetical protein